MSNNPIRAILRPCVEELKKIQHMLNGIDLYSPRTTHLHFMLPSEDAMNGTTTGMNAILNEFYTIRRNNLALAIGEIELDHANTPYKAYQWVLETQQHLKSIKTNIPLGLADAKNYLIPSELPDDPRSQMIMDHFAKIIPQATIADSVLDEARLSVRERLTGLDAEKAMVLDAQEAMRNAVHFYQQTTAAMLSLQHQQKMITEESMRALLKANREKTAELYTRVSARFDHLLSAPDSEKLSNRYSVNAEDLQAICTVLHGLDKPAARMGSTAYSSAEQQTHVQFFDQSRYGYHTAMNTLDACMKELQQIGPHAKRAERMKDSKDLNQWRLSLN